MSDSRIIQTDEGLGRYYQLLNRNDYFDDDGNGKFKRFCEDNGFDDDVDVAEELKSDATDCVLVEFDKEHNEQNAFPFKKEPSNKMEAILKIIKTCYNDPDAYKGKQLYSGIELNPDDFKLDEEEKKAVTELSSIYKKQCPAIFSKINDQDGALMNTMYIGKRMNHNQYLQLLSDLYARDRLAHYLKIQETKNEQSKGQKATQLSVAEWASMNKHTLMIRNWSKNEKEFDMIVSAVDTYYGRIRPLMGCLAQIKIVERYSTICEYISAAVDFVFDLANDEQSTNCPFQYDCCFAFNKVTMDSYVPTQVHHGNDTDDDDDDDDEEEKKNEDDYFYDCFGNIPQRLNDADLVYDDEDAMSDNVMGLSKQKSIQNRFRDQYEAFKKKLQSKRDGKEFEQYPSRFRFISILDRREPTGDNKGKGILERDQLIFVEPTSDCYKFPAEHMQCDNFWCFNSSKTEIIPCNGYNVKHFTSYDKNEQNKLNQAKKKQGVQVNKMQQETKEKLQTETVNTEHSMKNGMFLLSFHVDTQEEIRCYIYLGGCMMRFLADDLKQYLPQFFEQSDDNIAYVKRSEGELDVLIKNIKKKLMDLRFEAFYKEYKTDDFMITQEVQRKYDNSDVM